MPTAIITGANRGLGLELSKQYLDDGWAVIAICRTVSPDLEKLAKNPALCTVIADLTDDTSLASAVNTIEEPAIDLLINGAGTMGDGSFAETGVGYQAFGQFDRDEWHRVFDINVCTPMALTELLIDKLAAARKSCVVTLSSMVGSNALNTIGNLYAYRASKAAVNSIMKSMGANLASRSVIAIAMHPGWVRTDMGGPGADIDAAESVRGMRRTIASLTIKDTGKFLSYDGELMPY